ncbi:MAG: hypothetical protein AAGJ70_11080 [Pseudomonadota bacterium]
MDHIKLLRETLDAFGSDTARWPEGRAEALTVAMASVEGQRLLDEARALDRTLTLGDASRAADARDADSHAALLNAIMERTVDTDGVRSATDPSRRDVEDRGSVALRSGDADRRPMLWRTVAGGALAASLCIGFLSGMSGNVIAVSDGFLAASEPAKPSSDDTDELLAELSYGGLYEFEDDIL